MQNSSASLFLFWHGCPAEAGSQRDAAILCSFLYSVRFSLAGLLVCQALFAKSSNEARLSLLVKGLPGLVGMLFGLLKSIGYENRMLGKEEREQ